MLFQVRVLNASCCYFNPRLSRIVLAIPWAVDVQVYVCLGQPALQEGLVGKTLILELGTEKSVV